MDNYGDFLQAGGVAGSIIGLLTMFKSAFGDKFNRWMPFIAIAIGIGLSLCLEPKVPMAILKGISSALIATGAYRDAKVVSGSTAAECKTPVVK